jgi:ribose-phosphate pyrophosphokinase
MRGFFSKPVDNLRAEPIIARWIRHHVPDWHKAVVVSKNAGGSKRVTSLADTLKLSFGIITTDRRRSPAESTAGDDIDAAADAPNGHVDRSRTPLPDDEHAGAHRPSSTSPTRMHTYNSTVSNISHRHNNNRSSPAPRSHPSEPLGVVETISGELEEYKDERAREVITGRLVQGHIVDDDFPSPVLSTMSGSVAHLPRVSIGPAAHFEDATDPMAASILSTTSSTNATGAGPADHPLGGTFDASALSDEEEAQTLKDPDSERMVTLVGNVNDKTVFIIDDIIDGPESWIAAAETVVKRGNANKVYCIATHALFGSNALEQMEECDCIDYIVVCNTFPIDPERARHARKLVVLDLSSLLAEAIRRNHHGESLSQLYQQYRD